MNLDELRTVQSKERQKDSLQHLRPSFYQEVADYIAELKAERENAAEAADDPFSAPEVGRLTDEIETAKDVVGAIYERRMGKLVKQASLSAAGMPADDDGLTAEEQDLFEDLVARIQSNKNRVLDVLEGVSTDDTQSEPAESTPSSDAGQPSPTEPEPGARTERTADPAEETRGEHDSPSGTGRETHEEDVPPAPPDEPPADVNAPEHADTASAETDENVSVADVMGGGDDDADTGRESEPASTTTAASPSASADRSPRSSPADDPNAGAGEEGSDSDDNNDTVDRVTVRITRDVGSILGVDDREYTLSSDDVISLPKQNATPLVEREAAEPLE